MALTPCPGTLTTGPRHLVRFNSGRQCLTSPTTLPPVPSFLPPPKTVEQCTPQALLYPQLFFHHAILAVACRWVPVSTHLFTGEARLPNPWASSHCWGDQVQLNPSHQTTEKVGVSPQNWVVLKHLKDLHTSSCRGQGPSLGSPKDTSFSRIIYWVLAD